MMLAVSCTKDPHDDAISASDNVTFNDDGTLGVNISMLFPEMTTPTRAMGETPDYRNLRLIVLVFEDGTGLRQRMQILPEMQTLDDSEHPGKTLVRFHADLEPTDRNAVIHLIATDQADLYNKVDFGPEERVITALYTDNGHEAYWQRRVLGHNIPTNPEDEHYKAETDDKKVANIGKLLNHVPMIRNFCRVSVVKGEGVSFELSGIYVVNTVDRGSVAPYVAANDPERRFVDYCNADNSGKSYAEVSAQKHTGTLPPGVQLINGDTTDPDNIATRSTGDPVYFYERPARVNSTERTYVILKGTYTGSGAEGKETFYKIDLGHIDSDGGDGSIGNLVGRFAYYNLLRNFDYRIRLNSVASDGYKSFADAAKGAVFNNFSASVEARNMTSISDGEDMIFVSFTSYVFTEAKQSVELLAQFREHINENGGTVNNEVLKYVWDEGDVIAVGDDRIVETKDLRNSTDAWNKYKVTGNTPSETLRQQTLYIYRGNKAAAGEPANYGLYREVIFFLHTPWQFKHIDTFPGLWEDVDDMPPWDWSSEKREIGQFANAPLTLFFELPAGLPQALFPLEFVIESDRQNIQNAYQGNAVVRSVPAEASLFYDEPTIGKPTSARIQYVKTIRWEDYNGELSDELVGKGSSIVRCRFLTITDLRQDGVGGTDSRSTTTLRVANPYFGECIYDADGKTVKGWKKYHQDGFERNVATSDPTPGIWNFSSYGWSSIIEELKNGNAANYTPTVDDLAISAATARTLSSGTVEIDENAGVDDAEPSLVTYNYLRTTNSSVKFTHTRRYPGSDTRRVRIYVMATDDSDNPVEPTVELKSGTTTLKLTHTADNTTKPFASQVYESEDIDMSKVNQLDLTVSAKDNTPVRFYRIEFHPRWGEFQTTE